MSGPEARRDTDLERIEAALANGRATADDPRERELQELALALRADSAEPDPEFAAGLGRRVEAGFREHGRRQRLSLPSLWPALAAATGLILVAVVAISFLGGGGERRSTTSALKADPAASGSAARDLNSLQETEPRPFNAGAAPGPLTAQLMPAGRRVERGARLTIAAPRDKLQSAADGVGTVAEDHRGFVLRSQVNTGDAASPGGSFTLRVPVNELQATLADLSKLGRMRARSETGHDLTAPYKGAQRRLGDALIESRALKLKLRRTTGAEADRIRIRLARLRSAIDSLNARMVNLHKRTAFSTVYVTLEPDSAGAAGGGGTGAAWHDALHTLGALFNFTIRALAVILPLGLLAALAGFGTRALRRRRREAALM